MSLFTIIKTGKAILASTLFSFLILFSGVSESFGEALKVQGLFLKANKSYYEGRYTDAIKEYKALLAFDKGSWGEVHFNLGNAYFRAGELGSALFHFKKSSEVLPRDGDVKYNLEYLRSKTKDKVEAKPFLDPRGLFPLNQKEVTISLMSFWVLFWVGSLLYLLLKYESFKWIRNLSFFFVLLFSIPFLNYAFWERDFGVVKVSKASVFSGIGKDNVKLFVLHEGAEVNLQDKSEKNWVRIEVDKNKKGWMRKEDLIF